MKFRLCNSTSFTHGLLALLFHLNLPHSRCIICHHNDSKTHESMGCGVQVLIKGCRRGKGAAAFVLVAVGEDHGVVAAHKIGVWGLRFGVWGLRYGVCILGLQNEGAIVRKGNNQCRSKGGRTAQFWPAQVQVAERLLQGRCRWSARMQCVSHRVHTWQAHAFGARRQCTRVRRGTCRRSMRRAPTC